MGRRVIRSSGAGATNEMTSNKFLNDKVTYDAEYDPRFAPRFAEIATFLRAPHQLDLAGLDIGIAGVPFDGGATNRVGARHGPRAVRDSSSLMRATHHVFRVNPFELCAIADVGDVRFNSLFDNAIAEADITAFYDRFAAARVTPLSIGGDHAITYAILKGVVRNGPIGLVHIDAHTDTLGPIQGTRFHHGAPFRNAIEDGLLDPKRMIQIGIRGAHNAFEAWDFCARHGVRIIFIEELGEIGVARAVEIARGIVGAGPTYLSFDIDALDPSIAPGTGTPEAGGLTMREAQGLVRGMRGLDLVGADVVEVSPPFDPGTNTALCGATILYELLCILAEARAARRK
jgi:guanidinopropionase